MPGMLSGTEPNINPSTMPMKMAARLGSRNVETELPNMPATRLMAVFSPTTVSRSPNCRMRSGVARICTPLRNTRLMLMS